MKKIILLAAVGIVLCAAAFTGYKVYGNQIISLKDTLMKQNLEALADDEWDGWEIGYKMESVWRITGGGISIGETSIGINIEGEWINCCKDATQSDACNMMSNDVGC